MADSTARSDVDVLPRCHCSCHVDAPGSSAYVLELAISQIDKEIEQVRSTLDSLKRRRNALLPVSRLPPEILGKIFAYCAPRSGRNSETVVDGWFKFSHVSYIWRMTALECPSLWTRPMFESPGLARAMLFRSGACTLHIEVQIDDKLKSDFRSDGEDCFPLNLALEQAYRIETIRIEARTADFTEIIRPKLCWGNAARLESLSLTLVSGDGNDWNLDAQEYEIPRLTDLRLRGCVVPWSSPILRNLTSLGLQGGAALASLGWKKFFTCFGSLFQLSELYLQDALPEELNNVDVRLQIFLPALETLYVCDEQHVVATLLRNLDLALISHLHIELTAGPLLVDQADLLVLASSFLSKCSDYEPLRCVQVDANVGTFGLRAWTAVTKGGRPEFHLQSVAGYRYIGQFHRLLRTLRRNDWSSQVEDVVVAADDCLVEHTEWVQLFELFPRCQRATVSGSAVEFLFEALYIDSLAKAQSRELCYFPRLQEVHLDFLSISTYKYSTTHWMDSLNQAFQIRDDLRIPLDKLLIASTEFHVDEATTIRGVRECGKGARNEIDTLSSCQCYRWSD